MKKDISLGIATINGSGSQSANTILLRALFYMGVPASGKNLFPSNIAGLPTWYYIRANENGFTSRREDFDLFVNLNPKTIGEDVNKLRKDGIFFYNAKKDLEIPRSDIESHRIDFTSLVADIAPSIRLRKLLTNMAYVGVFAEILNIPIDTLKRAISQQFKNKTSIVGLNEQAANIGRSYAKENLTVPGFELKTTKNSNDILIDGNTAAGMGLVFGGCTFMSWYPITPSSSVAESFDAYAKRFRKDDKGTNTVAVVQAEDELAAIGMVAGAGWTGARSCTTTSGPGISLMAETAGLMYFAEVPGVILNVQRAGPSTGLPTRTLQGDVQACALLSHGDTCHPVLIPSTPKECFEFSQLALDLAERLQTLVFVLSDLDIGMNLWPSPRFDYPQSNFDRGKVVNKEMLDSGFEFRRYKDVDGDAIPYRTLPGTEHDDASFFTRGTGHDESAKYTENAEVFAKLLDRLKKKFETIKTLVPKAEITKTPGAKQAILYYGSSSQVIEELLSELKTPLAKIRLKAFPFGEEVKSFISEYDSVFVLEQNRDGQMKNLLQNEFPEFSHKLKSVLTYDGMPVSAKPLANKIQGELV